MSGIRPTRRSLITGAGALSLAACSRRSGAPDGLLRAAISGEPDSLDPLKGQFAVSALMYKQLHAPLTEYGPAGGLAPGLAEGWFSEDGRLWTFRLRSGLRWSDGASLTADDIVWTARRAVDPRTGFADLGDFFAVSGARAALRGEIAPEDIGVSAPDAFTVVFRFDQPVGNFPVLMREFYPLPRHAVEAQPEDWIRPEHWVSAGPYTLTGARALSYELTRNANFHAADSVTIEQVRVDVIEDAATRARLFRAGDLDLADRPPGDQIGFLRERLGDQLHAYPAPILTYLKVNCLRPHLADPRVRRALSQAIDRTFLNAQFFNGEAAETLTAIPADTLVGEADPDGARAALAAAGFNEENPLRLSLRASSGERERLAVSIGEDLRRAGVVCEIISSYPLDLHQAVDGGDYDLALARFDRGLKADPDFMVQPFAIDGFADDHGWSGAERDAFDQLVMTARGELDIERRSELHRQAEARLLNAQAVIPLIHERAYWMISGRVAAPTSLQPQLWRDLGLE
ncbi:MAG: peptide ABC transporter substrate-binding protein [Pseudomonadota bacterium]